MINFFFKRPFALHLAIFGFLFSFYILWLMAFAPGVLGPDSLAIVWHVEKEGGFHSGKTEFWFYFIKILYRWNSLFEVPILVQLFLAALIFTRIMSWCFLNGLKFSFILIFLLIAVAPHWVVNLIRMYPDAIFSLAMVAVIFELWLLMKNGRRGWVSLLMLGLLFPFAVFFRTNGLILLVLFLVCFFLMRDRLKWGLLFFVLVWCAFWVSVEKKASQGIFYPLALYETVGFLQHRPMNLERPKPRISSETIRVLEKYWPVEDLVNYYDRDYWDPLVHFSGGPGLNRMTNNDRRLIVNEFFTYNLWHNIPSFFSSRVNIFLVSSLGDGSFIDFELSKQILPMTKSLSRYRLWRLDAVEVLLKRVYKVSENFRFVLWSPFYGVFMIFLIFFVACKLRSVFLIFVFISMLVNLCGVFLFSIAGEYRYILPFFVFPVVGLPIIEDFLKNGRALGSDYGHRTSLLVNGH